MLAAERLMIVIAVVAALGELDHPVKVHGKSEEECEETLQAIAEATGITDRHALYSTQEFKKVRVRYFTDAERDWEADHS